MKMIKSNSYCLLLLTTLFCVNSTNVLHGSIDPSNNSSTSLDKVTLIDQKLGEYYKLCDNENYFDGDDNEKGKFFSQCKDHEISYSDIELILNGNSDPSLLMKKSLLIGFDPKFPILKKCQDENRREIVFQILKNIINENNLLKGVLSGQFCSNNNACLEEKKKIKKINEELKILVYGYLREEEAKLAILIPTGLKNYILKLCTLGYTPCPYAKKAWFKAFSKPYDCKLEIISTLLQESDIVDAQDEDGDTALMKVVADESIEIVAFLLQHGANADIKNGDGYTALHEASKINSDGVMIISNLIRYGANIHAKDSSDATPLMWALEHSRDKNAKLLLQNGARVDAQDEDGNTALLRAVMYKNIEIAELLLFLYKANVNIKTKDGCTALHEASKIENNEVMISKLIKYGANIHAKDSSDDTPLMWARKHSRNENVELLLKVLQMSMQ